jgi:hypothetical protein
MEQHVILPSVAAMVVIIPVVDLEDMAELAAQES